VVAAAPLFVSVLADLRARGARVRATAGRLRLEAPRGALFPGEAEWVGTHRDELLAAIPAEAAAATLADLRRAGFMVALGTNGFDVEVTRVGVRDGREALIPSVLKVPRHLFDRLVAHQDAIREHLRSEGRP
jgi:hypothetical protein